MKNESWLEWCTKQMSDLSRRLRIQGYYPSRLEFLANANPEFSTTFNTFMERIETSMNKIAEQPDAYHLYEEFSEAKRDFLNYTNLHRETFLETHLAHIA
jgi:hypothetical protein